MAAPLSSQINALNRRLNSIVKDFNRTDRKRVLRKGARVLVLETRRTSAFKDRTGVLRKSLNRVPGLNKSLDVFVGPLRGSQRRYDGYYASMVFGSSDEFGRRVLEHAAVRSEERVIQTVSKAAREAIRNQAAKKNLR